MSISLPSYPRRRLGASWHPLGGSTSCQRYKSNILIRRYNEPVGMIVLAMPLPKDSSFLCFGSIVKGRYGDWGATDVKNPVVDDFCFSLGAAGYCRSGVWH